MLYKTLKPKHSHRNKKAGVIIAVAISHIFKLLA